MILFVLAKKLTILKEYDKLKSYKLWRKTHTLACGMKATCRAIDCTSLSQDRNLPLMWSLDCLVMKVLIQIDLHL